MMYFLAAAAVALVSASPVAALPGRAPTADLRPGEEGALAWVIGRAPDESLRAARSLAEHGALAAGFEGASRLVLVWLTVGDGPRRMVLTNASSVADLLDALDLEVGKQDEVRPRRGRRLRAHADVRLIRVRQVRERFVHELPYQTLIRYSSQVAEGEIETVAAGAVGYAVTTYLITYRNGRRVATHVASREVISDPVDRIEVHGTGPRPSRAPAPDEREGDVEYGLASWYECAGMHAAHRTLPFGTDVTVTNLDNGRTVTVTINDRGPYVEGRIIDLCDGAFARIAPLGEGVADVKISY